MSKKLIKALFCVIVIVVILVVFLETYIPPLSKNYGKVETKLYLGETLNQPLIVGFGGSEGGNAWDSDFWKPTRDQFLIKGYAFLAVAYFGTGSTPESLDRISLNAVHDAILEAAENPKINSQRICLIGGSKGAELVLNIASYFDDIDAVVAMSPSHVSFPAITMMSNTSSWTLNNEELPFVPVPYSAVPAMVSGEQLRAYSIILENYDAEQSAAIPVEKINGAILLISPTYDESWPSGKMSEKIVDRLNSHGFPHYYEHQIVEGGHTEPIRHFDLVFNFLEKTFPVK
ncbi:acyl-CoA thioester hydrolase/BAAT C-terminal domain-containing protein [Fulvivirga sedimenti]|uniref:BAAT/Acyl-CoA thioester hydrolase C-terminal domain-containing protein n=1 Tax=Fulvivirga sedimenti TaxID=2879465 RepID=A0A9X1HW55_9BACT|nr:acyl-CoA thioester hydrolase/BAAT C-terminal domain-containing protein [Fulvivirga sedimenti]MCA6079035.1 hypothetical protein [Fulvivirga sedimenti]